MMSYIIITVIISITLFILYLINRSFEVKTEEKVQDFTLNIKSDCIVILSMEVCPYCIQLEEKIKNSKTKYTIITLNGNSSFKFDSTFLDLSLEERDNIILEVQKLFTNGYIQFPCIIVKNKVYRGIPKEDILNKIFNL